MYSNNSDEKIRRKEWMSKLVEDFLAPNSSALEKVAEIAETLATLPVILGESHDALYARCVIFKLIEQKAIKCLSVELPTPNEVTEKAFAQGEQYNKARDEKYLSLAAAQSSEAEEHQQLKLYDLIPFALDQGVSVLCHDLPKSSRTDAQCRKEPSIKPYNEGLVTFEMVRALAESSSSSSEFAPHEALALNKTNAASDWGVILRNKYTVSYLMKCATPLLNNPQLSKVVILAGNDHTRANNSIEEKETLSALLKDQGITSKTYQT
jgi:hypothetical protein